MCLLPSNITVGFQSHGNIDTKSCEPPCGCGKRTWIFCKNNMSSYSLIHKFMPKVSNDVTLSPALLAILTIWMHLNL